MFKGGDTGVKCCYERPILPMSEGRLCSYFHLRRHPKSFLLWENWQGHYERDTSGISDQLSYLNIHLMIFKPHHSFVRQIRFSCYLLSLELLPYQLGKHPLRIKRRIQTVIREKFQGLELTSHWQGRKRIITAKVF